MRVVIVASAAEDVACHRDAAHPPRLPGELRAALESTGMRAVLDVLPSTPQDADPWTHASRTGQVLADRLGGADGAGVLHALDPLAAAACLVARQRTGLPVAVRWGALGEPGTARERRLRTAVLRGADVVTSPTPSLARLLRGHTAAGDVPVVPDGIDAAAWAADPAARGASATGTAGPPTVASLSGPDAGGGTAALLAALARLPGVRLLLCGRAAGGSCEEAADAPDDLQAAALALGVADRVAWLGWLPRPGVLDVLDAADVVVAPRIGASSAAAAVEAMCRARPVVAADVPVLADVVVHRSTGTLVRPGDVAGTAEALRGLLGDPFRREAWGQAGYDRAVVVHDWARVVPLLQDVYDRALQVAARPRSAS